MITELEWGELREPASDRPSIILRRAGEEGCGQSAEWRTAGRDNALDARPLIQTAAAWEIRSGGRKAVASGDIAYLTIS